MRHEFANWITEKAGQDESIYLIVGDIGYGVFDDFIRRYPGRFINFGLCEQSMVSAASGMALEGLKPWLYTITPFLIERPFEQIKLDLGEQNANVKLVGYADYPDQGPTHAELDGIKLMQMVRNMYVFDPLPNGNLTKSFDKMYEYNGPAFIGLKKARE